MSVMMRVPSSIKSVFRPFVSFNAVLSIVVAGLSSSRVIVEVPEGREIGWPLMKRVDENGEEEEGEKLSGDEAM